MLQIDGASFSQYIIKIVLPLLRPVILLDILLVLISGFWVFDIVYVTTRGGPVHHSEVLTTLQYDRHWRHNNVSEKIKVCYELCIQ